MIVMVSSSPVVESSFDAKTSRMVLWSWVRRARSEMASVWTARRSLLLRDGSLRTSEYSPETLSVVLWLSKPSKAAVGSDVCQTLSQRS